MGDLTITQEKTGPLFRQARRELLPREVIACFVDIRGFTQFVEKSTTMQPVIQVIESFYASLDNALKEVGRNVQTDEPVSEEESVFPWPIFGKKLGDGVLIVWEYESDGINSIKNDNEDREINRRKLSRYVLDFVCYLQTFFQSDIDQIFRQEKISKMAEPIKPIGLGIGLSNGSALKVRDARGECIDYIGRPLNMASRLQNEARQFGIVVDLNVDPDLFMEPLCFGEGVIGFVEPKGISERIPVWHLLTDSPAPVLRWRKSREDGIDAAIELLKQEIRGPIELDIRLSGEDTRTIFYDRKYWESKFTKDLAHRVDCGEIDHFTLDKIESILVKMERLINNGVVEDKFLPEWTHLGVEFHSTIAALSTSDLSLAAKRAKYTREVYQATKPVYLSGSIVSAYQATADEHRIIFMMIKNGKARQVEHVMNNHVGQHYAHARQCLIDDGLKLSYTGQNQ